MLSEWKEYQFESLLSEPVRNGIYKKKEFHGRGARIVNMGELFGHSRMYDIAMKRVVLFDREKPKVLLQAGDLLFARRSLTAEGAGKCSIVKEVLEPTTFESSIIRARPNNKLASSDFLYYLFSSSYGKYLLSTIRRQVAVAGITGTDLKELKLKIPPLSEQKAIAHILGSLDDKIELNRKMNETLEAMAQAMFKSWFIDFDPVLDNAILAGNFIPEEFAERAEMRRAILEKNQPSPNLSQGERNDSSKESSSTAGRSGDEGFPSEFIQTDKLGWIPKGWEAGSLRHIVKAQGGFAFKSKDFTDVGFPVIKIKNINSDGTVNMNDVQYYNGKITTKLDNFILCDGDIVIAMTGATVGKSGIIVTQGRNALLNQRVARFINLNNDIPAVWFAYLLIRKPDKFNELVDLAMGSAQPNISSTGIESVKSVIAGKQIFIEFNKQVDSILYKVIKNQKQQNYLSKLRDTLLPKLLSGELRIKEAEKLVEDVT